MTDFIENSLVEASKVVSIYWPLQAFITVNPLWDMTDQSFSEAIKKINDRSATMPHNFYIDQYNAGEINDDDLKQSIQFHMKDESLELFDFKECLFNKTNVTEKNTHILYAQQVDEFRYHDPLTWIQEQCNHWLLQYFGRLTASAENKRYSQQFEFFWKGYVVNEHRILEEYFNKSNNSLELIKLMLEDIGIPQEQYTDYFKEILFQQYGWSSLIKWINSRPDNPWINTDTKLETIVLMWVSYEWLIYKTSSKNYKPIIKQDLDTIPILSIWQSAYEYHLHTKLNKKLSLPSDQCYEQSPDTQWVFCIDTRSEGIRRHIESISNNETYGFAGFFGFAFKFKDGNNCSYQSPAIIDPNEVIQVKQRNASLEKQLEYNLTNIINDSKNHLSAPFALFEILGILKLAKLIKSTFFNKKQKNRYIYKKYDISEIDDELAANSALGFLKTIGLTKNFAKEVIICAHQSISENNPYAAGLDCGACGGNSGVPNATIAALLLNKPSVRAKLAAMGLSIPEDTEFFAACHFTTHDTIEFLSKKPSAKTMDIANKSAELLREEKIKGLVYKENANTIRKENDWSDLIPELGLANNYALIIGPRRLNKHVNLERRTFLHSYEPSKDPSGEILAGIIAAPVVVAHWINSQYYFSSVNQKQFGAGNKAIHNVIPGIGLMEGNLSDLKIGLPQQSILYKNQMIHEPRKLLVIIYGNKQLIENVIQQNKKVNELFTGGWLTLKIIEKE